MWHSAVCVIFTRTSPTGALAWTGAPLPDELAMRIQGGLGGGSFDVGDVLEGRVSLL